MLRRQLLQSLDFCSRMSSNLLVSIRIRGLQATPPLDLRKNPTFRCNMRSPLSFGGGFPPSNASVFKDFHGEPPRSRRCFSSTRSACSNVAVAAAAATTDDTVYPRSSRLSRLDAQNALFEYLHNTRSLDFTDAEHMSKNSPVFLQDLMARIEVNGDGDVSRSLSRFLRYHPINEFEPFFESLGLTPSELQPLLPRHLMYLSDDINLLENYSVLCLYGVPRSKIGKMYKDGTEMFKFPYGVLLSKLQAYEKLGLSKPTIIKLVMCSPSLLVGDMNAEFLQVMEKLRSLGVELDWIRGGLSEKSTYNWNRILEMLNFLDKIGCSQANLARLVKEHPKFIFDGSGKRVYLLVAMLLKLGLKMDIIVTLFVQYPHMMLAKFTKNLWQSVNFLTEIGMETEDIVRVVCSCPLVVGSSSCKKATDVLRSLNITAKRLRDIIKEDPDQFGNLVSRKKTVSLPNVEGIYLQEKTNFLMKLGFIENSDEMTRALRKFRGRGDQLQERFDCLVRAGLDYHTVCEMIRSVPFIINQSADVLEKKINYLLNDLGYSLEALAVFPAYLCYKMERINLRFSMHKWLRKQGIVIPTKNRRMVRTQVALSTLLACSDARFFKYVVNLHPEGPNEWERLRKSIPSS